MKNYWFISIYKHVSPGANGLFVDNVFFYQPFFLNQKMALELRYNDSKMTWYCCGDLTSPRLEVPHSVISNRKERAEGIFTKYHECYQTIDWTIEY